jgi:D-3-phosphoglycerate dehydrogenase
LLQKEKIKYDYIPDISIEDLSKIIGNYDFIIVRGRTKLRKGILEKASRLKVIIRFGVGLDNIDIDFAKKKGKKVFKTPSALTEPVAELTLGMILSILRKIGDAHCTMRNGRWEKKRFFGYELANKTIAILGFGRIGRRVSELLMPFNTKIVAYDVIPIPEEYLNKGVIPANSIEEAVEDADIITLHMPLTEETRGLIDMDLFKKMRRKPFIINTARGKIIDIKDLKVAIKRGLIKGAALDVFPEEPVTDDELLKAEDILLTPHIGAQTLEAYERAAFEVIDILKNFIS